jgi:GNAT superfamily N-acetyltransferase
MHAESKYRCYNFDPLKLANTISELIEARKGIALVAVVQGKIVGGLIGYLAEHYFGNDLAAYGLALFIDADHRNGMVGPRLIKQYVEHAREKGASEIVFANTTRYEMERVGRLFLRLGFSHDGYVFSMNGNTTPE